MTIKEFAKEEKHMNEILNFICNESTIKVLRSLPKENINRIMENLKSLYKIAQTDEKGRGNIGPVLGTIAVLMIDISLNYDINYSIGYDK